MTTQKGPFSFNTKERETLESALWKVSIPSRRHFYARFRNFTNAWSLRMKWVQENAATNDIAREIWTAFVMERLK